MTTTVEAPSCWCEQLFRRRPGSCAACPVHAQPQSVDMGDWLRGITHPEPEANDDGTDAA